MKTSILFLVVSVSLSAHNASAVSPVYCNGVVTMSPPVAGSFDWNMQHCTTTAPGEKFDPEKSANQGQKDARDQAFNGNGSENKDGDGGGNGDGTKTAGKNKGEGGCSRGTYGGASCDTTDAINMGVEVTNRLYQGVGAAAVNNKGTDVQNALNAKGIQTSNKDYLEGQAKVADSARKSNNAAGSAQTLNAGVQIWRAMAHKKSIGTVQANADAARAKCNGDASCEAQVDEESGNEMAKQRAKALESGIKAGMTAQQAGAAFMQANMAKKTAEELRKMAKDSEGAGGSGTFGYDQQQMPGLQEGEGVASTVDTGAVTPNDPNSPLDMGNGFKDFNPNAGLDGASGPTPGGVKENAMAGAGAGGGGFGGSGGTSAAKGEGGEGKQDAAGKPQTGGMYSSGDGAPAKFGRGSGGGAGVGMDSSFADLLKKMLPSGEEEKKQDQASLDMNDDRSPASDKAAVIGRNKNIFVEISKRYQKKHSEGAVQFQ